jgi:hypothetical protein
MELQPNKIVGITQDKRTGRWIAQKWIDGKRRYLGSYAHPEEALRAYNRGEKVPPSQSIIRLADLTTEEKKRLHLLLDCLLGDKQKEKVFVKNNQPSRGYAAAQVIDLGYVRLTLEIR